MPPSKTLRPRPPTDASRPVHGDGTPQRSLRRDAVRNRQRLLDAAVTVFAEHGFEVGIDEVARVAGIGTGTIYRRFPTKEALIDELVKQLYADVLDQARQALAESDGRGLDTFLIAVSTLQSSRVGYLARLWRTEQHAESITAIRAAIADLLADAQRHGRARAELTPWDIFMIIWSMRGIIEMTRTHAPDAWRRHLDLMLAGVELSTQSLAHEPPPAAAIDHVVAMLTDQK
jgi:AcrR family transcriptional regulator